MKVRTVGSLFAIVAIPIGIGVLYSLLKRRRRHNSRRRIHFKTIFFPDSKVACKTHFTQRHGCTSQRCGFSHDEELAYAQFMSALMNSRTTLDVCVFCITCSDLVDVVIGLHNQGIIVRVITDDEQVDARGSQIAKFRAAGIQVRTNISYLMHHKFAIVDGTTVINGSFNWTRQAITGNHENLTVTNEQRLVEDYQTEFHSLWEAFHPPLRR